MIAVGFVGYQQTLRGLKAIGTAWATKMSDEFRRRYYKNWKASKKMAFKKSRHKTDEERETIIKRIQDHSDIVRLICHTQIGLLNLRQKKSHVMEIQVNGGNIESKVAFCIEKLENSIEVA